MDQKPSRYNVQQPPYAGMTGCQVTFTGCKIASTGRKTIKTTSAGTIRNYGTGTGGSFSIYGQVYIGGTTIFRISLRKVWSNLRLYCFTSSSPFLKRSIAAAKASQ